MSYLVAGIRALDSREREESIEGGLSRMISLVEIILGSISGQCMIYAVE